MQLAAIGSHTTRKNAMLPILNIALTGKIQQESTTLGIPPGASETGLPADAFRSELSLSVSGGDLAGTGLPVDGKLLPLSAIMTGLLPPAAESDGEFTLEAAATGETLTIDLPGLTLTATQPEVGLPSPPAVTTAAPLSLTPGQEQGTGTIGGHGVTGLAVGINVRGQASGETAQLAVVSQVVTASAGDAATGPWVGAGRPPAELVGPTELQLSKAADTNSVVPGAAQSSDGPNPGAAELLRHGDGGGDGRSSDTAAARFETSLDGLTRQQGARQDDMLRSPGLTPESVQPGPPTTASARPVLAPTPGAVAMPAVPTPVGDSDWGNDIGDRVLLMANTRTANAEIRLTPAELGPLRVQLSVDEGVATVTFHSSQAATREAIEQALPRLRDLLADNGLTLGQANVSEQDPRDGGGETHPDHKPAGVADDGSEAGRDEHDAGMLTASRERLSRSLVDTFV